MPSALFPRRLGILAGWLLLALGACAPQPPRPAFIGAAPAPPAPAAPAATEAAPVRAALLLPLSGSQAPLGQALLNAGYLALFDEAPTGTGPRFEFFPRDTGGTPAGAAAAAQAAIREGAKLIVGPLTSGEAAAVAGPARAAGVPVLAFTNDGQRAGEGVWVLGTTPTQQVRRVMQAGVSAGARRFGLAAQDTEFGRALAAAMTQASEDAGLARPVILLHPAQADPTMAGGAAKTAFQGVDAVLLGETGDRARRFVAAMQGDTPPELGPKLLGTSLWLADTALREPVMAGAIVPGPEPRARAWFEARYRDAFRETPPRIAAVAYDAAALAARAVRLAGFSGGAVSPVTGDVFPGADGPVRLLPGGITLRGLAVFTLQPGGEPLPLEPAPVPGGGA